MGNTSSESVLKNFIDILQSASPQLKLAIALLTPWALLTTAVLKYSWAARWLDKIKSYVSDCLFASVSIPNTHPLHRQILAYMVDHGLGRNARTLALASPSCADMSASSYLQMERLMESSRYDHYSRRTAQALKSLKDDDPDRRALSYVPEIGKYAFWFKWHRMTFERKPTMSETCDGKGRRYTYQSPTGETIVISCTSPFAGAAPIQEFLQHIQAAPAKDRTTTIYRPNAQNSAWDQGISRPSRNLNAVTLDAKVKNDLVKDIQTYLSPATRKYYANRGIPYRRGLLFYGNPGCGKTSFTNALAGHFGLNVYMFSLSSSTLHDGLLESLFEQLPSRCIVLLEDIDSAGLKREKMWQKQGKKRTGPSRTLYDIEGNLIVDHEVEIPEREGVTLSGLLNVLDGIHSKEGMLTIMTSNSPDTLDPALVRPGRIDRKILFGYCSKEVLTSLFTHIFKKAEEEIAEGEPAASDTDHDIAKLAKQFADEVPADKLTPAEVQGYLLVHREDPIKAVEGVEEWAKNTIERKAAGANVDAFASETQKEDGKGKEEDEEDDEDGSEYEEDSGCETGPRRRRGKKRCIARCARDDGTSSTRYSDGRAKDKQRRKEKDSLDPFGVGEMGSFDWRKGLPKLIEAKKPTGEVGKRMDLMLRTPAMGPVRIGRALESLENVRESATRLPGQTTNRQDPAVAVGTDHGTLSKKERSEIPVSTSDDSGSNEKYAILDLSALACGPACPTCDCRPFRSVGPTHETASQTQRTIGASHSALPSTPSFQGDGSTANHAALEISPTSTIPPGTNTSAEAPAPTTSRPIPPTGSPADILAPTFNAPMSSTSFEVPPTPPISRSPSERNYQMVEGFGGREARGPTMSKKERRLARKKRSKLGSSDSEAWS